MTHLFNGKNIEELKNMTGRNVWLQTETKNSSDQHPEGFDYPIAIVEAEQGNISLSIGEGITVDVNGIRKAL